jgi:hypothetical protein
MRQSRGGLSTVGQWALCPEAVEKACSAGAVLPYHLVAYLLVKSFCLGSLFALLQHLQNVEVGPSFNGLRSMR